MIVYRLERHGIGPFMGRAGMRGTTSRKKNRKANHIYHQCPKGNVQFMQGHRQATKDGKYLFGTASKELLLAYFSYNLQPFFKQGYRIRKYNVPDSKVIHMGSEVAFPVGYHKLKSQDEIAKRVPRLF